MNRQVNGYKWTATVLLQMRRNFCSGFSFRDIVSVDSYPIGDGKLIQYLSARVRKIERGR